MRGGRLTQASQQSTEGEELSRAARKRTKVEVAANVYEALAEGLDEPMEMFKPALGRCTEATDNWNRARVKRENNERKLRNEIRRIAREERDRRISARIERKRTKQELRRAARIDTESTTPRYFASEHRQSANERRLADEAKQRAKQEQQLKLAANMREKYRPPSIKQQPREPYEPLPKLNTLRMFTQQALSAFNAKALGIDINRPQETSDFIGRQLSVLPPDMQHFCIPVIHPVTGEHIINYMRLKKIK